MLQLLNKSVGRVLRRRNNVYYYNNERFIVTKEVNAPITVKVKGRKHFFEVDLVPAFEFDLRYSTQMVWGVIVPAIFSDTIFIMTFFTIKQIFDFWSSRRCRHNQLPPTQETSRRPNLNQLPPTQATSRSPTPLGLRIYLALLSIIKLLSYSFCCSHLPEKYNVYRRVHSLSNQYRVPRAHRNFMAISLHKADKGMTSKKSGKAGQCHCPKIKP